MDLLACVQDLYTISQTKIEFQELKQLNLDSIKLLQEKILNTQECTIGELRRLESILSILISYNVRVENRLRGFITEGVGLHDDGGSTTQTDLQWQEGTSAFKSRIKTGIIANIHHKDPKVFLQDAFPLIQSKLQTQLARLKLIKVNFSLCAKFTKVDNNPDSEKTDCKYFNTQNFILLKSTDFRDIYDNVIAKVLHDIEEMQFKGSGWSLHEIINLTININKYQPIEGNAYIPLPTNIQRRKAVLNITSNDRRCFIYAVLAGVYKIYSTNVNDYPKNYHEIFNLKGIEFPVSLTSIRKFEKQNSNISINVYSLNKKNQVSGPLYYSNYVRDTHINLLYLNKSGNRTHYCWIYDLSKLCSPDISVHNKSYICDRCLIHFYCENKFSVHSQDCKNHPAVKIELPKDNENILKFNEVQKQFKSPMVIYADFECLTKQIHTSQPNPNTSYTNNYQEHQAFSVAYQVVSSTHPELSHFELYRGHNPAKWFVSQLKKEAIVYAEYLSLNYPMIELTPEQLDYHNNTSSCSLCSRTFDENLTKVMDHDHSTGLFRATLCSTCNLNYKPSNVIQVFFHSLSGFDSHIILKELNFLEGLLELLPITIERYISFSKEIRVNNKIIKLRFLDSYRFLPESLENLAKSLTENDCFFLKKSFPDKYSHLIRKGVFPYDYVNDFSRLEETQLPNRSQFYNALNNLDISDEDYNYAQFIWNEFNINNLGAYSDLYLKTDVLLLTDIFEKYRKLCLHTYGLDPVNYYTCPGFSYSAMLKVTKTEIELLTDIDMILFCEKAIRGGLVQVSKRYAKANNKYLPDYDSTKPNSFIAYFDINNMYGFALSKPLPYSQFQWDTDLESVRNFILTRLNLPNYFELDEYGYILEVTVLYPENLHEMHKDLPLLPHHFTAPNSKQKKLMTTLHDKEIYVLHYTSLIQALKLGLILDKIHRALKFRQSPWLKPYIDLNSNLRAAATEPFEKNLYKLKTNSIFGKTLENIRNYRNIHLVTKWGGRGGAKSLIAKPNFKSCTIFNENLIAVEMNKEIIKFNKPIYIGLCVLDISKTFLYDYHYSYFTKLVRKCDLLYTDTDSLIYHFINDEDELNIYEIIRRDCLKYFDTSDYPPNNPFNIPLVNKKVLGLMKDEGCSKIIREFVGLRSKMYSIRFDEDGEIKKAKGIGKSALREITFDSYKDALFNNKTFISKFNSITFKNHNLYSTTISKKSLNANDDKRQIQSDNISTLPWGYRIPLKL